MTAKGLHHPIIGQRKQGSTVALLRRWRDLWAVYATQRVDPIFREEIMLAVAGANSSRQCSFAHREWARSVRIPEVELAAVEGLDTESLDERTWAAFAWAQAYARNDLTDVPDTVDTTFKPHFSAQEQSDIALTARTMYWLNETSNSFDAFLSRLKRKRVTGSTLLSELVALVLYAIAVPILIVMFSILQRRNPFSLIRAMKPFFREFETRGPHTISGPGVNFRG
jgi:alkylhydroperoxidase family enzyme